MTKRDPFAVMDREIAKRQAASRKRRGVVLLKDVKVGTTVYAWDGRPMRVEVQMSGTVTVSEPSERVIVDKIVTGRKRIGISPFSEVRLEAPE